NFNVTLENLKNTGADVQKFVDADCEDDSYALVSLKKYDNGEKTGDYDIEVHLNCKNYKSEENK
ncbi:MAG: hypothetical protein PHY26_03455, partial [Bacilli bacterium]|nr:hypothetical protein [Bacilli bacterium]